MLAAVGKGNRNRDRRRQQDAAHDIRSVVGEYDPHKYSTESLQHEEIASDLGPPIDGWVPQLTYRFTTYVPAALIVDWAIMLNVYRVSENHDDAHRRRVQRIDICESEVHVHEFRRSDDPNDDQGRRVVLMSISADDDARVSGEFALQMGYLSQEWPERVRRWIDG